MRHYCTLFDSSYLAKGLVLYESLKKHSSEPFTLHVLAMDKLTMDYLWSSDLNALVAYPKDGIVTQGMRRGRNWQEFCWTMASNFTDYLLTEEQIEQITYLDADLMFFSDPKVIFDEIGERSIAVIPHRLIPSKKHLEVNGKFNVSWVTFKNNPIGRECVSTWAAQCREKCSAKDGCGDQKYLDEWPDRYGDELCIVENNGVGLAPWNLANYDLVQSKDRTPKVFELAGKRLGWRDEVVFYHYHEFMERPDGSFQLTNYKLRPQDQSIIYEPYLKAYREAKERIYALQQVR